MLEAPAYVPPSVVAAVAQEAIARLERAFPAVPLDPEAALGTNGPRYLEHDTFVTGARDQRWPQLTAVFLERHHDALVFIEPASFSAYLPAYLAAIIRGGRDIRNLPAVMRGLLTRGLDAAWFDARINLLTHEQKLAVAQALAALEVSAKRRSDRTDIAEVIDSYWRDLVRDALS